MAFFGSCGPVCRIRAAAARGGCAAGRCGALLTMALMLIMPPGSLCALHLIAETASGRTVDLGAVEEGSSMLEISFRGKGLTLEDPVVDIEGFAGLTDLLDLRLYNVPQIASYRFLIECRALERLVISFGRVRSLDFLSSLPKLKVLHLEFCSDWESEYGLPFAAEPIDLSANGALEYIGFRVCDLRRVPVFPNPPESLRYVDLSYNPLVISGEDAAALKLLRGVDRVFVTGAEISKETLRRHTNLDAESPTHGFIESIGR